MKIAYIARWDVSAESGVLRKMLEQIRAWRESGHDTRLFALSQSDAVWEGAQDVAVDVIAGVDPMTRPWRFRQLLALAHRWDPDVAYLRFRTASVSLAPFMRRVRTVVEINSDDRAEFRLYLPRYQYRYHLAARHTMLAGARGFVCVSRELGRVVERYERPLAVIANGIALSAYAPSPAPLNPRPRVVFMGAPGCAWHGIDEIHRWAALVPEWEFELIGSEPLPAQPPNVRAHGFLRRDEYEPIIATSDIAVGTLALYRKSMDEASPLKVRECLAYGLPCVNGYLDTDFTDGAPFILQLENRPGSVASRLDEIREFVGRWKGRRVPRSAIEHVDVRRKEEARLTFLEEVAAR